MEEASASPTASQRENRVFFPQGVGFFWLVRAEIAGIDLRTVWVLNSKYWKRVTVLSDRLLKLCLEDEDCEPDIFFPPDL